MRRPLPATPQPAFTQTPEGTQTANLLLGIAFHHARPPSMTICNRASDPPTDQNPRNHHRRPHPDAHARLAQRKGQGQASRPYLPCAFPACMPLYGREGGEEGGEEEERRVDRHALPLHACTHTLPAPAATDSPPLFYDADMQGNAHAPSTHARRNLGVSLRGSGAIGK